jgi:hypothetical protein
MSLDVPTGTLQWTVQPWPGGKPTCSRLPSRTIVGTIPRSLVSAIRFGLPIIIRRGVALLDGFSLSREVLARGLAVRAARLDVHDEAHDLSVSAARLLRRREQGPSVWLGLAARSKGGVADGRADSHRDLFSGRGASGVEVDVGIAGVVRVPGLGRPIGRRHRHRLIRLV